LQYLERSGNEKGEDSLALNLGAGRGYSVLEVIRAVEYVTGRAVRRTMGPRRAGDPPVLVADPAKAQSLLGWSAKRNFSDIVSSAWRGCGRSNGGGGLTGREDFWFTTRRPAKECACELGRPLRLRLGQLPESVSSVGCRP